MSMKLKLLAAVATGMLTVSLAGAALAKSKPARSTTAPVAEAVASSAPAFLRSEGRAAADTGDRASAEAERQLQGVRGLPGNGGGAEGLFHDGDTHDRSRSLQG